MIVLVLFFTFRASARLTRGPELGSFLWWLAPPPFRAAHYALSRRVEVHVFQPMAELHPMPHKPIPKPALPQRAGTDSRF